MTAQQKILRWIEMLALFVGGPALIWQFPGILGGGVLFLFLMLMGAACAVGLYYDKKFDNKKLWNAKPIRDALGWIIIRWMVATLILITLFGLVAGRRLPGLTIDFPTSLFRLFNRDLLTPGVVDAIVLLQTQHGMPSWLAPLSTLFFSNLHLLLPMVIGLMYPWVSVYPQNVIYRAFFCQRYRPILGGDGVLIVVNAAAFSFGHIMFNNWVVLLLTFVGGIFFTRTYLKQRSLLLSTIEHSMYGITCFYIGIGVFLLYGASG